MILKNGLICRFIKTRIKTCLLTRKWLSVTQYSPRYSIRGQVARPLSINFLTWLLFDLGTRGLKITSTTNLESGPLFTRIVI